MSSGTTVQPDVLRLRERSERELSASELGVLEMSPAMDSLIDAGVVSLVRSRRTRFAVRAGPFVGRSRLSPSLSLAIDEKSPGALRALLDLGLPDEFRTASAPSYVAPDSPVLEVFASRFLDALGVHLSKGRVKEYRLVPRVGPSPHGRIDMRRTARLHARGLRDRMAYVQPALTPDLAINVMFALALHAVESYSSAAHSAVSLRTRARRLALLFEDVNIARWRRADLTSLRHLSATALNDRRSIGDIGTALHYARALVLFLGAWGDESASILPESYFANLERLFEDAVRRALEQLLPNSEVQRGSELRTPLFADREDRYIVDPDAVVVAGGSPVLVVDVKYKDLQGLPDHSDVYQLVAHTRALGSDRAVLIYPGENVAVHHLGASDDVTVSWAFVRPQCLLEDVDRVSAEAMT